MISENGRFFEPMIRMQKKNRQKTVRVSRYIYSAATWLFLAGVVAQVFLDEMAVAALQMGWATDWPFRFWLCSLPCISGDFRVR